MDNINFFSKAPEFQPNIYDAKLAELLDWCQLVQDYLNSGQIEDAKFFLSQAIAEAKRPVDDIASRSPLFSVYGLTDDLMSPRVDEGQEVRRG